MVSWKEGREAGSLPSVFKLSVHILTHLASQRCRKIIERSDSGLHRQAPVAGWVRFGRVRVSVPGGTATIDTLRRVRSLSVSTISQGGVTLAMSLDIVNAFNALPWGAIRRELEEHRIPAYLKAVVEDYLRNMWIEYPGRYGMEQREVYSRVLQGSVLGPWRVVDRIRGIGLEVVLYKTEVLAIHAPWGKLEKRSHMRYLGLG